MLRGFGTLYWGLLGPALGIQWILGKVCLFKRPQQLVDSVVLNAAAPGEPRQRRGKSSRETKSLPRFFELIWNTLALPQRSFP